MSIYAVNLQTIGSEERATDHLRQLDHYEAKLLSEFPDLKASKIVDHLAAQYDRTDEPMAAYLSTQRRLRAYMEDMANL